MAKARVRLATVRPGPLRLGLASRVSVITDARPPQGKLAWHNIEPSAAVVSSRLGEILLPLGSAILHIIRTGESLAVKDDVELRPGDRVLVFCRRDDRHLVGLLFGRAEREFDI